MAISDYKSSILVLILVLIYLQFFHDNHHGQHSKLQISNQKVLFHANWTKSLDDICCLEKLHDAFLLSGIQTLDVSLSMSSFNQQQLRKIFAIHKFRAYKNIKLDISGLNISNTGIDYVLGLIQHNVQNLQLNMNGLTTNQGFGKELAQRLNSFPSIKTLKISLIMSIKSNQVNEFISTHKPTQKLDTYHLILIGNQITKQGIANLQQYLTKLDVNQLKLNLYANKLGAQGAQLLSNSLKQQLNLQSLGLDLYFNNVTELGTQNITAVLQAMTNLKQLELNLDFNYIKNEGGKAIGKMLEKMTNLQALSLGVGSKNFGYLGFKYVVSGLQKLTQLKKLVFRCGVNRVGINGAEITKEMLSKMNNLQHLELGFIQNYVGDDGISLLAEQVASMKNLKNIYLNLAFNDAKSYGLIRTVKAFLNNKYDNLHISLSSNEFRDNDVKLIESHLTTLIKNNKQFTLDFTDTAISKVQMKRLQKVFSETNQKNEKTARLSVNSIIPQEQPVKAEAAKAKQQQKKVQNTNKNTKKPQKAEGKQQQQPSTSNNTQSQRTKTSQL